MPEMKHRIATTGSVLLCSALACQTTQVPLGQPTRTWDEVGRPSENAAPAATAAQNGASSVTPTADPATPPRKMSIKEYAQNAESAAACEQMARDVYRSKKGQGWALLKACVARGDFTQLSVLLDDPWLGELGHRRGSAELLTHVVAMRGGDIHGDLAQFADKQIPLFELHVASNEPDLYKDRLVMLRGKVSERTRKKNIDAVVVAETSLGSETYARMVGPAYVSQNSSYGSGTSSTVSGGSAKVNTSRYGSGSASYSGARRATGGYTSGSSHVSGRAEMDSRNVAEETGRNLIVNLTKADPFLVIERDYIFLARFDGVRKVVHDEMSEPDLVPVLTLVAYFVPSPRVVF